MNAPTTIRIPREERTGPEIRVDETRDEHAHRHAIGIHLTDQDEFSMAARVEIAIIRDQAMAGQSRARSGAVAGILHEIAREAMAAVYAPMPAKRLFQLRCALAGLMEAARGLERSSRDEHGGR